jgi:hypothetical protein
MATNKIGWEIWCGSLLVFWALYPVVLVYARSVLILALITAAFGVLGWLFGVPVLMVWSGGVGLCNLTLALLLIAHPPDLWVGLSAGILLLALVDSSQRLTYIRQCWLAPGVATALLRPFVRLSSAALLVGLGIGLLLISLHTQPITLVAPGALTVVGASFLAGFIALFVLYTNHWPGS